MKLQKVYYWNKAEWQRIENAAKELESMRDYVNETHRIFGNELSSYIKEESRFDEVDVKIYHFIHQQKQVVKNVI